MPRLRGRFVAWPPLVVVLVVVLLVMLLQFAILIAIVVTVFVFFIRLVMMLGATRVTTR